MAKLRPIDALEATIHDRRANPSEKSYTSQLLSGGIERIGSKVLEEAAELVEAAGEPAEAGNQHAIYEAGDLLYHMLVLLAARGVELAEVESELARRFGMSGLAEKASRHQG
ncbi:MAG: phosphoribosyl-ATP diphosphatase [Planctomycetota bacterium]